MEVHSNLKSNKIVGKNLFACFPELSKKWLQRKIDNVFLLKNFSFTSWEQRPYLFKFPHNRMLTASIKHMRQDCTLLPMRNEQGEVNYVCFTVFDVTDTSTNKMQLQEAHERLREASIRDVLTGIYNRRYLEESLAKEFNRAQRYSGKLSLILLDIDFFKKVNDQHGHLAGDQVLREVGTEISTCLRHPDIVGRYGGEEFLFILPETSIEGAKVLAERLRKAIENHPIDYENTTIYVTASLGAAELRTDLTSYENLINESDRALYQSKANGRNQVTIYIKP